MRHIVLCPICLFCHVSCILIFSIYCFLHKWSAIEQAVENAQGCVLSVWQSAALSNFDLEPQMEDTVLP